MRRIAFLLLALLCFQAHAAQFWTNFDSFGTGSTATQTSGTFTVQDLGTWSSNIVDLGAGDLALRNTDGGSGNDVVIVAYGAYATTGAVEVVTKIVVGTTADQNAGLGAALCAADGQCYGWRPNTAAPATAWRLALFSAAGAVSESVGTAATFSEPSAGSPMWLMVGRDGSGNIYGSLWITDGTRPGSPMASANPTTDLTTVAPSIYSFDSSDDPIDCLIFGAGNNGSAAPEAPPGPGCPVCVITQQLQSANDEHFEQPLRAVGF